MKQLIKTVIIATICLMAFATESYAAKPFRVLVVIGDQWEDPASYMVSRSAPTGEFSGYFTYPEVSGSNDFHQLMILLKSWGIPFDVIRLDQQFLDRHMFLGMDGDPIYGTIIWDVNQSDKLLHPDYSIVQEMVVDQGIGLIALSDRISQPAIQSLLGLKYRGSWESNSEIETVGNHFLTDGLQSLFKVDEVTARDASYGTHLKRQQVEVLDGTEVIITQGSYPQATVKTYESGSRVVWIGNDYNNMFNYQDMRTLLRRSITWTIGYNLFKTWENDIIMIMDDPGGVQNAWLEHWQYPTLTEDLIEKYLIRPLVDNHAVLNINFVPGMVNEEKRRLEPTWKQDFIDEFGTRQDYISGKRGYDKGVKLGVFEVLCHGLTHMQPDLVSDPGWYGAPLDQEKAEVGWYREFGDTRRQKEIPAAEQLWRMKTAKQWLTEQFGVTPLQFCAGGNGASVSYHNNTVKLAAKAGFGWCGWTQGYCGTDMVIIGWDFLGTSDAPSIVAAPPNAHDFGIATNPKEFAKIFDQYPQGRFISINEFIGYLHTKNSGNWMRKDAKLQFRVEYDPHYCQYFSKQTTSWNLEIADWLWKESGEISTVKVDGKSVSLSSIGSMIEVPSGTGAHMIEVEF
ncbi:MAG: hypothetical protein ABFS38_02580 [Bacteroidota bacterium]